MAHQRKPRPWARSNEERNQCLARGIQWVRKRILNPDAVVVDAPGVNNTTNTIVARSRRKGIDGVTLWVCNMCPKAVAQCIRAVAAEAVQTKPLVCRLKDAIRSRVLDAFPEILHADLCYADPEKTLAEIEWWFKAARRMKKDRLPERVVLSWTITGRGKGKIDDRNDIVETAVRRRLRKAGYRVCRTDAFARGAVVRTVIVRAVAV